MTILVTDIGFNPVPQTNFVTLAEIASHQGALDLGPTDTPEAVIPYLDALTLIRITTPGFADGRAFTTARRLRALGYDGTLRALGPMIADQYPMARRVGFDQVEIPDQIALRQPQEHWQRDWRAHDYQARLRA